MKKIAVLITFHNRKNKTLACLNQLFNSFKPYAGKIELKVFLTDDGSSDGTSEAITANFSCYNIKILQGTGSLYWAGGMRKAWSEAIKDNFDGYLLLNDDTLVSNNVFDEIFNTHEYSKKNFNSSGIYIGTTHSSENKNLITYGGSKILNYWRQSTIRIIPNGTIPQLCDLGNANIMFVTNDVVQKIGIIYESYSHSLADYDYTLTAKKKKIPVLVTENVCGICDNDHTFDYKLFEHKNLQERIAFAHFPLGFEFNNYLNYNKRNFWYRLPLVFIVGWLRIFFPFLFRK
jgi:GT2 family glycosyltransferase